MGLAGPQKPGPCGDAPGREQGAACRCAGAACAKALLGEAAGQSGRERRGGGLHGVSGRPFLLHFTSPQQTCSLGLTYFLFLLGSTSVVRVWLKRTCTEQKNLEMHFQGNDSKTGMPCRGRRQRSVERPVPKGPVPGWQEPWP